MTYEDALARAKEREDAGDPEGALAALDDHKDVALVGFARGALLLRLGRREEAIEVLTAAYDADPDVAPFAVNLAAALLTTDAPTGAELDRAEHVLAAAVRQNDPEALLWQARVLERRGHDAAALHLIERAIAVEPTAERLYHRARALFRAGRTQEAERALRDTLLRDPTHPGARASLARHFPG